jgi:hypothetical protein
MRHKELVLVIGGALAGIAMAAGAADIFFKGRYVNQSYGFALELPPGFELAGMAQGRGEGAEFTYPQVKATLSVRGGEGEVNPRADLDALRAVELEAGWLLGRSESGPTGVTIEGRRDDRHVDLRYASMCEGTTFALYRLEYDVADYPIFEFVRAKLETSFGPVPEQDCR